MSNYTRQEYEKKRLEVKATLCIVLAITRIFENSSSTSLSENPELFQKLTKEKALDILSDTYHFEEQFSALLNSYDGFSDKPKYLVEFENIYSYIFNGHPGYNGKAIGKDFFETNLKFFSRKYDHEKKLKKKKTTLRLNKEIAFHAPLNHIMGKNETDNDAYIQIIARYAPNLGENLNINIHEIKNERFIGVYLNIFSRPTSRKNLSLVVSPLFIKSYDENDKLYSVEYKTINVNGLEQSYDGDAFNANQNLNFRLTSQSQGCLQFFMKTATGVSKDFPQQYFIGVHLAESSGLLNSPLFSGPRLMLPLSTSSRPNEFAKNYRDLRPLAFSYDTEEDCYRTIDDIKIHEGCFNSAAVNKNLIDIMCLGLDYIRESSQNQKFELNEFELFKNGSGEYANRAGKTIRKNQLQGTWLVLNAECYQEYLKGKLTAYKLHLLPNKAGTEIKTERYGKYNPKNPHVGVLQVSEDGMISIIHTTKTAYNQHIEKVEHTARRKAFLSEKVEYIDGTPVVYGMTTSPVCTEYPKEKKDLIFSGREILVRLSNIKQSIPTLQKYDYSFNKENLHRFLADPFKGKDSETSNDDQKDEKKDYHFIKSLITKVFDYLTPYNRSVLNQKADFFHRQDYDFPEKLVGVRLKKIDNNQDINENDLIVVDISISDTLTGTIEYSLNEDGKRLSHTGEVVSLGEKFFYMMFERTDKKGETLFLSINQSSKRDFWTGNITVVSRYYQPVSYNVVYCLPELKENLKTLIITEGECKHAKFSNDNKKEYCFGWQNEYFAAFSRTESLTNEMKALSKDELTKIENLSDGSNRVQVAVRDFLHGRKNFLDYHIKVIKSNVEPELESTETP